MNKFPAHDRHSLNSHSVLFQIGRLLFPELINHGRRMRMRMLLIFATLGVTLAALTAGVLWKEYRMTRGYSAQVRPLK